MISYSFDKENKIMEFYVGNKITAKDYDNVLESFKKDLHAVEEVNIIELISDWKGIEPLALWKDIKFAIEEFSSVNKKVKKAAVVADPKWIEAVTQIFRPFLETEIKFFKPDRENEAREWISH